MDILLDKSGDLYVSPQGDIALTESVAQKIRIRLLWFAEEWRWSGHSGENILNSSSEKIRT